MGIISLVLNGWVILKGIQIPLDWAYLFILSLSMLMGAIDTKLTCMAYVMPTLFIVDETLVLTGLKSHYFNLAYTEMIILVGALHCIEGLLTFAYGGKRHSAIMTYRGKKAAGGYQAYGKWFIPLLFFSVQGIYIPLIAVVIYLNESFVFSPKSKSKIVGAWILMYGLSIMGLGYLTYLGKIPLLFSMLSMTILHELLFSIDTYIEQGELLYPYPKQGIRVMELEEKYLRKDKIKIEKGDIILKVNGELIQTEEAYLKAIQEGNVKLTLKKISGALIQVEYTKKELKSMALVFLPPL